MVLIATSLFLLRYPRTENRLSHRSSLLRDVLQCCHCISCMQQINLHESNQLSLSEDSLTRRRGCREPSPALELPPFFLSR